MLWMKYSMVVNIDIDSPTGFNASEGVAFAPADWLRFLEASVGRHRRFRQPSPISHELLLLQV